MSHMMAECNINVTQLIWCHINGKSMLCMSHCCFLLNADVVFDCFVDTLDCELAGLPVFCILVNLNV